MAVPVRDGVLPMELGPVHQLFGAAAAPGGRRLYEVAACAPEPGPVRTDADFTLHVDHGPEPLAAAGLLDGHRATTHWLSCDRVPPATTPPHRDLHSLLTRTTGPNTMPLLLRIELDSDKYTARRIFQIHKTGKIHHESREAAREEALQRGRIPTGDPRFVGITNGEPTRLIYDVPVDPDTTT